ncbi:MAG: DUF721 domain-containing protein [Spirochaetales bacterium]|nr:DUF721 domain-containing protein [Spirochaetales bacterium]
MDKAGHILKHILGSALSKEAQKYSSFFHFFHDLLGQRLSAQIEIRDIVNNVIIAEASHPGWIQTFAMKKQYYLKKIQERYPDLKIKDIQVKLGKAAKKKPAAQEQARTESVETTMNRLDEAEQQKVIRHIFSEKKRNNIF